MSALTGTSRLVWLALRRERLALPLWTGLLTLLVVGTASGLGRLYPTPEAQAVFARQINRTPAEIALLGQVLSPTLGGLTAWRVSLSTSLLAGLMGLLTVIRHTRSEEERGRLEVLRAGMVGRGAPLTAALAVAFTAHLALAALVVTGLMLEGLSLAGSVALGLALSLNGAVFTALAAVMAQLSRSARTARLLVGGALGIAFLLRVIGDTTHQTWLSWLSPLGWVRFTRPFADEAWWVLTLPLLLIVALIALAYALAARRDLGAGWFQSRPGPATARPGFSSPFALAWHLQRGWLLAWTAAFGVLGAVFGDVAVSAAQQLDLGGRLSPALAGGRESVPPADLLFTLTLMILGGELSAACGIGAALRLRAEEVQGRADLVLSTAVGRVRWAASHLGFALLAPALPLIAFGVTAGLSFGRSGDPAREAGRVTLAALVYLPAVWTLAAFAVALFGLLPRWTPAAWVVLAVVALIDLSTELQLVSGPVAQLSPFTHVPKVLLGQSVSWPLAGLLAIAAVLTALGLLGLRRRDMD